MREKDFKSIANNLLKKFYGENANFREGQYEAIEATLTHKRTLVVQKTGWGKSLVYFMTTKILREQGKGMTLVISPLLVLMENQKNAAENFGLRCKSLNSEVEKEEKNQIIEDMIENKVDLVFITPETLFSDEIYKRLPEINISLLVIDEAHCISDWGHDFRLKYTKIYKALKVFPSNVSVLATTATANDRVVEDLRKQLGDNVYVSRGELMRKSLSIQVLKLDDMDSRYAWILENINKFSGSGIIYCLTHRDCENLANFLSENGISARSYYSRDGEGKELNKEIENLFLENKIKVIVATIKLGMGYDKGDISFVIHYQCPSNIVAYYQQIGRAGRNIKRAYTFLMMGKEDKSIQDYFINSAFPTREECEMINDYIYRNTDTGVTISQIEKDHNLKRARINKIIAFLENEDYIVREKSKKYYSTVKEFVYDEKHYNEITEIRRREQEQMFELATTTKCYSKYVVNALDDRIAENCGICKNCLGYEEFPSEVKNSSLRKAQEYLERLSLPIEPRKMWPLTSLNKNQKIATPLLEGVCLAKYGVYKYGKMVARDKYSGENYFCEELLEKSCEILKNKIKEHNIQGIVAVPSLRSEIVSNFAKRLAKKCDLPYIEVLGKKSAQQQKNMSNSSHQCENALSSFYLLDGAEVPNENLILVDDIVDSRWTLTVCGELLIKLGAKNVMPFALADSSNRKDEE